MLRYVKIMAISGLGAIRFTQFVGYAAESEIACIHPAVGNTCITGIKGKMFGMDS